MYSLCQKVDIIPVVFLGLLSNKYSSGQPDNNIINIYEIVVWALLMDNCN